ncbi:MAG: DNA-directed RNA polymerase subunit omega [Candidatus Omnitrophica bacterium]|nr:DNA-directed RNA polymerase subunit omega [Candidatus Omnitrophota bacterium]
MPTGSIENLLERSGGIYRLVILAARRAKELAEGAPPLIEASERKATSIALEEILQGKILYKDKTSVEDAEKKKGRGGKAKGKKAA